MNFILDRKAFIYVLTHFLHLSFDSSSDMVMSFYGIALSLTTLLMTLIYFFEICGHIVHGHVPPSGSCFLVASRLLALEKQVENV